MPVRIYQRRNGRIGPGVELERLPRLEIHRAAKVRPGVEKHPGRIAIAVGMAVDTVLAARGIGVDDRLPVVLQASLIYPHIAPALISRRNQSVRDIRVYRLRCDIYLKCTVLDALPVKNGAYTHIQSVAPAEEFFPRSLSQPEHALPVSTHLDAVVDCQGGTALSRVCEIHRGDVCWNSHPGIIRADGRQPVHHHHAGLHITAGAAAQRRTHKSGKYKSSHHNLTNSR